MMISIKFTILSCLVLMSCNQEYIIKDDKVYLKGWNEGVGSYRLLLEEANASTFQTISSGDDNSLLGKDDNHVYYERTVIKNCDPKTINYLGNYYYADQDSVYFFGFYNNVNDCEVIGANPKTIRMSKLYPWANDDKHIIYGHTVVKSNDIEIFTPLSETWAKTDTKVFYKGIVLKNANAITFKVVDSQNGKDKNRNYHEDDY